MLRRLAAAGFAAALISGGLVLTAGSAHAAQCPTSSPAYPADTCGLSVSATTVEQGGHITVAGDGFSKDCDVAIRLDDNVERIALGHTDANGHFSTEVTIPSDAAVGTHRLSAHDRCSTFVLAQDITVTEATSGSGLPFTGLIFWPLVGGGAGLVLVGFGLVLAGRRRRGMVTTAV
jgi:hypothetical protein